MTSKIIVNNIEADSGVSTVTFGSNIQGNLIGNVTGNVNSTGVTTVTSLRIGTGASISSPATNVLALGTNNVESVRIDSSGNLGINTANPTDKLTLLGKIHLQQDSSSNNRIIFRGTAGSSYRWNIDNYSTSNTFRIFREDDSTTANGFVAVSISTTGTVTANKFSGDGSLLTGIVASGSGVVVQNQGSNVGTAGTLNFSTNLTASFSSGTATISLSNNPSISGILTADQIYTSNNNNGTNIRI